MAGFSTEEIGRVVDEHNRLRREVGVPEMKWDATLAAHAQTWAECATLWAGNEEIGTPLIQTTSPSSPNSIYTRAGAA